MLTFDNLEAGYGAAPVLKDFTLEVAAGETLCLLGRNGAGKTTALRAVMGLLPASRGRIVFDGVDLTRLRPEAVPALGIGYVPQGRRLFTDLTVRENLEIGLMTRRSGKAALDAAIARFPVLAERFRQKAGTLSGGEQQMLAIARALCVEPRLLLMDEPTEGLMPAMVAGIREVVAGLAAEGVTTLLVEQRVEAVLPVASRVAFVDAGRIAAVLGVEDLARDRSLIDRHVGVGR